MCIRKEINAVLQRFKQALTKRTTSFRHPCASSISHLDISVEEPLFRFDFAILGEENELSIS